jgi:cytochrome P450
MSIPQVTWQSGPSSAPQPPMIKLEPLSARSVVAAVGQLSAFFLENYVKNGPIYRYVRADQEYVALAGPEANQFLAHEGAEHIRADEFRREQNDELGVRETLVSMNGAEHQRHRAIQQPGYARSALDDRYPQMVAIIRNNAATWQPGTRLLVTDVMPRIIAGQLGVGVLDYPLGDRFEDIALWARSLVIETVARTQPRSVLDTPRYHAARDSAMALADEVIADHRARPRGPKADLVDCLLAAGDADAQLMTEQELRVAVLGGYVGGLDTVAYTCSFMLYALLRHPDIMARVIAEVDAAFADGPPTPATLRKMTTLRYASMETLRLYPVSPAVQSTVAKPFEFAGYRVEQGQNLILGATVPHLLPYIYADPFRFDVDRFAAPRNEHRLPGVYAPYGMGPHICLGAGMATVLMMLTMATLLHAVKFAIDPHDYRLKIHGVPAPAPADFHVQIVARRHG